MGGLGLDGDVWVQIVLVGFGSDGGGWVRIGQALGSDGWVGGGWVWVCCVGH